MSTLTNSHLKEETLLMRLATKEEAQELKEALDSKKAEINGNGYDKKILSLLEIFIVANDEEKSLVNG